MFYGCNNLESIYLKCTTPPKVNGYNFSNVNYTNAVLYVPQGSIAAYQAVDPWKLFWDIQEFNFNSSIESTVADNEVKVYTENGNIVIGTENAMVEVYNLNGECIYYGTATTIPVSAKGLYIVKVNNKSFKVIL